MPMRSGNPRMLPADVPPRVLAFSMASWPTLTMAAAIPPLGFAAAGGSTAGDIVYACGYKGPRTLRKEWRGSLSLYLHCPPALPIHLRPLLFNRVVLCTPVFASGSAVPSLHDVLQVSVHLEYPHEPSPCACVEAQALLAPTPCLPVAFTHKETCLILDNFTAPLCCSDATSSRKITP